MKRIYLFTIIAHLLKALQHRDGGSRGTDNEKKNAFFSFLLSHSSSFDPHLAAGSCGWMSTKFSTSQGRKITNLNRLRRVTRVALRIQMYLLGANIEDVANPLPLHLPLFPVLLVFFR
ncbi:hypothetical protein TcCL_Unassigned03317 [Trypanosoma cruzi]|nr:hypothetical protein TcCL_Unassigned03317 [Trypanosoma cruzi]